MNDDEILRNWGRKVQLVEPDIGSASNVFRRVKLHEAQVREAAADLPFESEPANFHALINAKATGGPS